MLAQAVPRPSPVQRRASDRRKMRGSDNFCVPEGGRKLRSGEGESCAREGKGWERVGMRGVTGSLGGPRGWRRTRGTRFSAVIGFHVS